MGIDIKSLKNRIKSVDSTLHLTKAMGLVASAKMRSAIFSMTKSKEYENALDKTVSMLTAAKSCQKSVYMKNGQKDNICLVVIAGDRGLAGGFNTNIFKARAEIESNVVLPIGKRACDKYAKELFKAETYSYDDAIVLAKTLCKDFKEGKYEKIGIVSTRYQSMMTQTVKTQWILPLEASQKQSKSDMIFEPDEVTVLEAVIEEYVAGKIISATKESFACEVIARRFAMDNAGKNAGQMIDSLKLEYNRARQGAITQEITEIVAGSGI